MRIVMTGASGLIGSAVRSQLMEEGHDVLSLGRRGADHALDLADFRPVDLKGPCDVFIHCAGITDEEILRDRRGALKRGTTETAVLFDWAASLKPSRIIYISTAHVYGDLNRAIDEGAPAVPLSLYGTLHLFCENYLRSLGVPYLVLRPLTVFGEVGENFSRWGLIPFSFPRALALEQKIVLNTHGRQGRNFISTRTIARTVAREITGAGSGVINAAGPHSMSVRDFAGFCIDVLQPFSERQLDLVVKKDAEHTNNFRYVSGRMCCKEDLSLLKDHVVSMYEMFRKAVL
jgi:nucleoside-diphosphate-sugar epimerase